MAKGTNQKAKLLYLAKIFYTETDELHGLTMSEIISRLKACDVNADRKTLYLDFEELRHFGLDIGSAQNGKQYTYHLLSREFELAELKLLVDSVQSSKFITEKKSAQLIRKLEGLVSAYEARQLQRQVLISGRIKTMNESIYYNVDKIHAAISSGCQIRFRYFQWNLKKEEELRRGGAWYRVSPWHLRWDDENYYLIGCDNDSGQIRHYRVDKMRSLQVTQVPREGEKLMEQFDPTVYTSRLFGMYAGDPQTVTLEAENKMIGILIDRFGKDIPVLQKDSDHFITKVSVAVSEQFLGWIISLGSGIRITGPDRVTRRMQEIAARLSADYSPKNE